MMADARGSIALLCVGARVILGLVSFASACRGTAIGEPASSMRIVTDSRQYTLDTSTGRYVLKLRAFVTNESSQPVFLPGFCGSTQYPTYRVLRPAGDTARVGFNVEGCADLGDTPSVRIGPGDTFVATLTILTAEIPPQLPPTLAKLTGAFQLLIDVRSADGTTAPQLVTEWRTSNVFTVVAPRQ